MPTWLKIASALIFIVVMIAWKFVVKAGVTAFDWWFTIPVLFVVFGLAHLIERSDAKKRQQKSSASSDPQLDMPSKDIPDYYNVLGVSRDADRVVIQAAYRALAKKYHPDTTKENPTQAQMRFAEISAAYSALSSVIHTDKDEIARSPPTEPTRRTAATKSVQQNGDLIFWVPVLFIVVALAVIGYFASKPPSHSATSYSPSELSEMVQQSLRELKKTNH